MDRKYRILLAIAAALAMGTVAAADWAEEAAGTDVYAQRIADLEAKVAALESAGAGGCQAECCPDCTRVGGIVFGAELTFLQPHHSNGIVGYDGTDMRFDLEPAPRFWMGWVRPSGVGFRVRYWDFDHTARELSRFGQGSIMDHVRYDMATLDIELTDIIQLDGLWELTLSGGARYVDFDERNYTTDILSGDLLNSHSYRASLWGPTLGAEIRRPVWRCFSVFANVRGSILFGDEREYFRDTVVDRELCNVKSIAEMQLGTEWSRPTRFGGRWFVRGAVEAQYWNSFSGEYDFDGGETVGLFGFALSAGLMR